ncbi:hypothetical protein [Sphingobium aromaticiconvertens]|uniref:hypothetical protein n=1 Tax=Sphingobium aromaticiconvertens TaxID=365341 RepID=UPI003019DABD
MAMTNDAAYLLRRARDEARKALEAAERGDDAAAIAAHREMAIRYKVRALSQSSGAVPCIDGTDIVGGMSTTRIAGNTAAQ